MQNREDIIKKYTGKRYPPLQKKADADPQNEYNNEYQAVVDFKRSNHSPRFRIVNHDGVSYGCSYAHLIDWIYTSPSLLIINTTSRIFTIEGKNLDKIERLFMDERVKELRVYNPSKHLPPQKGEAVIETLELDTHGV